MYTVNRLALGKRTKTRKYKRNTEIFTSQYLMLLVETTQPCITTGKKKHKTLSRQYCRAQAPCWDAQYVSTVTQRFVMSFPSEINVVTILIKYNFKTYLFNPQIPLPLPENRRLEL